MPFDPRLERPLDEAQLAALLASRICHDLISPVGAINNALELYDDDADMREESLQLIRSAAVNASARLQFARLAYGASGAAHFDVDSGDVQAVAALYMNHEKSDLIWQGERLLLPKIEAKLLLNLLLVANASLPRGGTIEVTVTSVNGRVNFILTAEGTIVKLPPKFAELLSGDYGKEIDAHMIQFYYTCLLADLANKTIACHNEGEKIIFTV